MSQQVARWSRLHAGEEIVRSLNNSRWRRDPNGSAAQALSIAQTRVTGGLRFAAFASTNVIFDLASRARPLSHPACGGT
ncbi:MAG: hypothetical protein JOZ81_19975 [Chloroflexi bacterium]|nr:hypothetical protein [Chloroflexota bacterium]